MKKAKSATPGRRKSRHIRAAALVAGAALSAVGGAASAQTMGAGSGQFNSGYHWNAGGAEMNQAVNIATRDDNNNTTFINGVMQAPQGSIFSQAGGASQSTSSGVGGYGSATAIGNNLVVVTEGSYNRVVVNSTQTNTGDVSAGVSLNGRVNLDGTP